jgi:hypothetical protein
MVVSTAFFKQILMGDLGQERALMPDLTTPPVMAERMSARQVGYADFHPYLP